MSQGPDTGDRSPKRMLFIGSPAVALLVGIGMWFLGMRGLIPRVASAPAALRGPFSTNFAHAENPLSDGDKWYNGKTDGLDWTNVRTSPGLAFGTEVGGKRSAPLKYDDSTAILKGTWGPNQTVQATVRSVNPNQNGKVWEEVELRLRSSVSPHNCTGYEVMFRCTKIPQAYCNIARWEGPLGKFTYIKQTEGSKYGVKNGDVVKATMIGSVLTVYINGEQMVQVTDNKFKSGNPGMGFYLEGAAGVMHDYGFSNFMATDE